jgi:hypothetical protein
MKGAFLNNVERKLSNGLVRNGHYVFDFSDRDAAKAGSLMGPHRFGGRRYANETLRTLCRDIQPQVLILGQTDIILAETVGAIRADLPSLRVLQWTVDPLEEPGNVERLERNMPVVDASLITTAGDDLAPLSRPGKRLGFMPNPVDFSIERGLNHLKSDLPFDLFYACGNPSTLRKVCGRDWRMDNFMRALLAALPKLRPQLAGLLGRKGLGGAAYQAALESAAIGLNISRRNDQLLYSSDRLAHLAGNGLAVVIERSTGYDQLFSEDQMAFYSSFEELVGVIGRLSREPERRMSIAAAGRARYHDLFNERRVAQYVLDVALDRLDPAAYPWPTLYAPA